MPEAKQIKYRAGYKYQLVESAQILTDIMLPTIVGNDWVYLSNGLLVLERGYAWDGPSGLTEDTSDSMRAALYHDGFYQLMRQGYLSLDYREAVDRFFLKILLEDGMLPLRAGAWFAAVRIAAGNAALPASVCPVLVAP